MSLSDSLLHYQKQVPSADAYMAMKAAVHDESSATKRSEGGPDGRDLLHGDDDCVDVDNDDSRTIHNQSATTCSWQYIIDEVW